ncbi:MAG: hypothetical protein KDA27_06665 [Candidatus Eisenbacteria bacterium]|uniref:Fibronectin type-III domain-containing protein n=1 Tax=Eiseniibacteriota bacterium TaxID=2212470 RepID=A0A956SCK4_UNCEI|nr:hypothetical protein [Candidatus Eisenbacteria bacterium]MCB9465485.1 hypothetical protein [Candidatus Eisenbacteria bacterium]
MPISIPNWLRNLHAVLALLLLIACGSDEKKTFELEDDFVPPAAVEDLRIGTRTDSTLTLLWTSPGDDGEEGIAWLYDVRRSPEPIDSDSWDQATPIHGEPGPSPAGRTQLFILRELDGGERVFFALRTEDEWGNVSELSNVVEAEPLDRTSPGRVTDLAAAAVGPLTVRLTWTATGDDGETGTASGYVLRYAEYELDASNFSSGTLVDAAPIPAESGSPESFEVEVEDGGGPRTVWFALQVWDEVSHKGPVSNAAQVELTGTDSARGLERGR